MISAFEIYLLGQIDSICELFSSFSKLMIFVIIYTLIIKGFNIFIYFYDFISKETKDTIETTIKKIPLKTFIVIAVITGFTSYLIPSTKTLAAMYIVPAVINDERVQGITNNALDKLLMMTDDWVKDTLQEPLNEIQKEETKL